MKLEITPQTRVGAILDAYPELEAALLAYSPHFAKLRNPILRRTVAKVATLQAAAVTAGVDVAELVRHLRAQIGQADAEVAPAPVAPAPAAPVARRGAAADSPPSWIAGRRVVERLDADAMLNRNEHPLGRVQHLAAALDAESMIEIASSFRPEPLIQMLAAGGHRVACWRGADGRWTTAIARGENAR